MVDPVSSVSSALQATLTGDLLKTLSAALASGSVTDAPPSVTNTQSPLAISGTLSSQLENGSSAVLQTAAGPITLSFQTPAQPLPQGTLTLLIQPGNPPTASVINQQAVTPQAQIQTQADAAQQTQDVVTQPAQALPPITVGQVLTATPLPPAPALTQAPTPVVAPAVTQAAASAAVASAVEAELPIAVLLNSAIPPSPASPSTSFVKPEPFLVDAVEASPEEEAVAGQMGQTYSSASPATQGQSASVNLMDSDADLDEDMALSSASNILAAQESVNEEEPVPVSYNPPTPVQAQSESGPQSQDFLVLKVSAPDALQTAAPLTLPQTQTVMATVVAQTAGGQPLLETEDGPMLINQRVSSPIGTELTLQRLSPDEAAAQEPQSQPGSNASSAAIPGPAPLSAVPLSIARQQSWPALTQLLDTLSGASPMAASYLRQAIPTLGNGFAQAFTAYLTRDDTTVTYPPAPGTLAASALSSSAHAADAQAVKSAMLQLGDDFASSALKAGPAMQTAQQAQAWQTHQVPILIDYGISMAQLFVRRQPDIVEEEPEKRSGVSTTRFLLEVSPSQLGPVQLDGLLRKTQTKTDRLDLIVRTEFAVPPHAAGEMASLFQGALGATGIAGSLGFQVGAENFVLPQSDDGPYRGGL